MMLTVIKGFPYKYIVKLDSTPFGKAPAVVLEVLQRLTWAGKQAVLDGSFQPFNELLAVGYFEKGSMGVCTSYNHQHPWRLLT